MSATYTGTMPAFEVTKREFGQTPDGQAVDCYTLNNRRGMSVDILTYGARIHAIRLPDMHGEIADVTLGFDDVADYAGPKDAYFGATVGRYANRIGGAHFDIDGETHDVSANEGENMLHGGKAGLDKKVWSAAAFDNGELVGVELTFMSPAGDMGFPGTLAVTLRYSLDDANRLQLHYSAVCDAPTPINLTNHVYFNLAGAGSGDVSDHMMRINASRYTPVDTEMIPTGEVADVEGTPMDFTRPRHIGESVDAGDEQLMRAGGYDFNWILDSAGDLGRLAVRVADRDSGRAVEMYTSEPGVQFYTGNNLPDGLVGKDGAIYNRRGGFCLEAQHFPDAPNKPRFASTILRPNEKYTQTTIYKFLPELTPRSVAAQRIYDGP